jgi:hypothetical protein
MAGDNLYGIMASLVEVTSTIGAVGVVVYKLGRTVEKFEAIGMQQASEITELKRDVKSMGELITQVAVQTTRQDTFESRLARMEQLQDDMRRGEGFILPLMRPSS